MNKYKFEKVKTTVETYEVWAESENEARDLVYDGSNEVEFTGTTKLPEETNFVEMLPICEETEDGDGLGDDDAAVGGRYEDLSIKE